MTDTTRQPEPRKTPGWRIAFLLAAVLAAVLIGLIVGFLVAPKDGANDQPALPPIGQPTIVSGKRLSEIAQYVGPVYWNGVDSHTDYEVTLSPGGTTYVRYVPKGTPAGSKQEYLTVATYHSAHDISSLLTGDASAKRTDAAGGAIIVTTDRAPLSAYFSFPKANFQVEVFSPRSGEAKKLVESGHVALVP
jgi:hypothetical protein